MLKKKVSKKVTFKTKILKKLWGLTLSSQRYFPLTVKEKNYFTQIKFVIHINAHNVIHNTHANVEFSSWHGVRTILWVIMDEFLCETMFEYFRECAVQVGRSKNRKSRRCSSRVARHRDLRGETSCKAIVREYGPWYIRSYR